MEEPAQEETKQPQQPFDPQVIATLSSVFPMRNTFTFDSQIVISSDFDSGNLAQASPADDLNSEQEPTEEP